MKHTAEQIARAFEIADEAMLSLLRSHTVKCVSDAMLLRRPLDDEGREVATVAEADAATQDAVAWLSERGLCEIIDEPGGEVITLYDEE